MDSSICRMILVCQHLMIKEGFEKLCNEDPDYSLVQSYQTLMHIQKQDFDNGANLMLICFECNRSDLKNPESITSRFRLYFPLAKPVIINSECSDEEKLKLITLGIKGFFPKVISVRNLKKALKAILEGETWISRKLTGGLLDQLIQEMPDRKYSQPVNGYELSGREMEILQAMAAGLSNMEISEKLFISEKTVKAHVHHIFKKMGVKSRTQAVIKALDKYKL